MHGLVPSFTAILLAVPASSKFDTANIEKLTGAKGALDEKEGVFKVSFPRADLKVVAGGVHLTPPMGLTAWAAFTRVGRHTAVMGIVAIHQHMTGESPRVGAHAEGAVGALAKELKGVKVTLAQGLKAAAAAGRPISGKFEVENGKLQLSIYAAKDGAFSEVIVDHRTGKVAKTEPIASGDDLTAANAQSDAMASARISLADAVKRAEKANKGDRAVSVVPSKKDGSASADVTLMKGADTRTVSQPL